MERKGNFILLIGLLIITLCISVIGTTFSYFGATNRNMKGETTIQFSKGTLIFKDPGTFNGGFVNAGETLVTKTFTVGGKTDNAENLPYVINFNVENTYGDEVLFYTINAENTSSNGTTVQSSTLPVAIPSGTSTIEIGTGSFTGPIKSAKHTYTLTVFRAESTEAQPDASFNGELDVTQGS